MSRTLVIGDIHGGLKALEQVFERAQVTQTDKLIFLGDYVDGWSQSAQLIDYLMALSRTNECVFIKGNHDTWCHEWLIYKEEIPFRLKHGALETINSYHNYTAEQLAAHLQFFENLTNYYIDDKNRLFIHAGFSSMHGPASEHYESNYSWDRTLWEMAVTMDKRIQKHSVLYPKRLLLFNEIYIGHTPTLNYNETIPMQGCNVWNIDTGAAFLGKLTCLDIDTKQFWQSDEVFTLYPNEKGRNK